MSEMQGGSFKSGFLAAGFTQALSPAISGIDSGTIGPSLERTIAAAIVGGTASVIGGGKFANGAMTGAFSRLFNDDARDQKMRRVLDTGKQVNSCGGSLQCRVDDVAGATGGRGRANAKDLLPFEVKWGVYDCLCLADGRKYTFVAPGGGGTFNLDPDLLRGVSETTEPGPAGIKLNTFIEEFTIIPSNSADRFFNKDFVRSFEINNKNGPDGSFP